MVTYAADDNENVIVMYLLLQYCVVELAALLMYAPYTLRSLQVLRLVLKQNLLYQYQEIY